MSPRSIVTTFPTAAEYAEQRRRVDEEARQVIARWRAGTSDPFYTSDWFGVGGPSMTALGELHGLRVIYLAADPNFVPLPQLAPPNGEQFYVEVFISVASKTWPLVVYGSTAAACVDEMLACVERKLGANP